MVEYLWISVWIAKGGKWRAWRGMAVHMRQRGRCFLTAARGAGILPLVRTPKKDSKGAKLSFAPF